LDQFYELTTPEQIELLAYDLFRQQDIIETLEAVLAQMKKKDGGSMAPEIAYVNIAIARYS